MAPPRKDISALLGQPAHPGSTLIVVSDAGYSGRQRMVDTRCVRCGASARQRLYDATSGHAKSCGCIKKEAFIRYHKAAVLRIPKDVSYEIYTAAVNGKLGLDYIRGPSVRRAIAAAHGITAALVDFTKRHFDERILAIEDQWIDIYERAQKPNASMPEIAAEFDLPLAAIRYILTTIHDEKLAARKWRLEEMQIDHDQMAQDVSYMEGALMGTDYLLEETVPFPDRRPLSSSQGTLHLKDFQLNKKSRYGPPYHRAKDRLVTDYPIHARETVRAFLRLCAHTLATRKQNQEYGFKRHKQKVAEEKRRMAAKAIVRNAEPELQAHAQ